jgi:Siphovirus ReqiPepy6 Gp37-like protein
MDLIKLSSVTANPTELSFGEAISGYTTALWVERYRDPGEFKIEAPLSSGLITFLPIGSFITHLETSVVMMVENHEIKQPKDADPTITISGRCFTCFLENRTVGDEQAFITPQIADIILASDQTWDQAVSLIDLHLVAPFDANDDIIGLAVNHTCSGTATVEERNVRHNNLHEEVLNILKVDDLGIKSIRPTPTEPLTYFTVYRGNDVSTKVRFSWMRGDLDNVEYFFSNKKLKNQARVMGRWVQVVVNPTGADHYDRRTMIVDAAYIDQQQSVYPSGMTFTLIQAAMTIIGGQALAAQNNVSITQADVSDTTNLRFRKDYNLGDLVTVDGDFGTSTVMRVVEYAEAEDESGITGHPTLAIPGEY